MSIAVKALPLVSERPVGLVMTVVLVHVTSPFSKCSCYGMGMVNPAQLCEAKAT